MDKIGVQFFQDELEQSEQVLTVELAETNSPLPAKIEEPKRSEQRFQCRVLATSQILWQSCPVGRMAGASPATAECTLVVEDNGIGFAKKYLDRIFTGFQRLHGRSEYEGTRVGLAICRKIARLHGGDITARSAPNQGSTFMVTLAPGLSKCASYVPPEATVSDSGSEETQVDSLAACGRTCL